MKRKALFSSIGLAGLALSLALKPAFGQEGTTNPYKGILERLESLEALPLPDWRYHADIAASGGSVSN